MLNLDVDDSTEKWISSWNARDLPAVLTHFAEDVAFTSPLAARIDPASLGIVRGKQALSQYWSTALDRNPDLNFQVTSIFQGVDCILIGFRNERGEDRIEMLRFHDGLVVEGHGTFVATPRATPPHTG